MVSNGVNNSGVGAGRLRWIALRWQARFLVLAAGDVNRPVPAIKAHAEAISAQ